MYSYRKYLLQSNVHIDREITMMGVSVSIFLRVIDVLGEEHRKAYYPVWTELYP
jgi:hypothetical protein